MIIGYSPGQGPLHRSHPLTALSVALAVAILAFVLPDPWGPSWLAGIVLMLAVAEGGMGLVVTGISIAFPFWVFLLLIHGVMGDAPLRAVVLGSRITAMLLAFLTVLTAVHPARLVDALLARRVPFALAYLLASTLQAVPRLRAKAGAILDAQRCRGLRVRGSVWARARAIVPLAVPLVLGALSEVDERTVALEVRGAGAAVKRTPLNPPRDTTTDRLVRWGLVVAAVIAVLMRVL